MSIRVSTTYTTCMDVCLEFFLSKFILWFVFFTCSQTNKILYTNFISLKTLKSWNLEVTVQIVDVNIHTSYTWFTDLDRGHFKPVVFIIYLQCIRTGLILIDFKIYRPF